MASGRYAVLNTKTIAEIVRLRLTGMAYKRIALKLGCTPDQAIHYWRTSTAYKPRRKHAATATQRAQNNLQHWQEERRAAIARRQTAMVAEELKREIANAVDEAATAPLFKTGDLVW